MKTAIRFLLLSLLLLAGRAAGTPAAEQLNEQAQAAHRRRSLNEASGAYRQLLQLDPPAAPTAEQRALARKYLPRLFHPAGEFFPLKDIAIIIHPDRPVIGYHLFWEDDIGYPSDNDPCDHEIVWVEYEPAGGRVVRVSAYFHGAILAPAAAADDANAHGGRPWIGVEWGFHGSLPLGALTEAEPVFRRHWALAHHPDASRPRDPLARGWPEKFPGDYAAYVDFRVPDADVEARLAREDLILVSRWPMATLNRHCLRYNFAVKTEWPWLAVEKK